MARLDDGIFDKGQTGFICILDAEGRLWHHFKLKPGKYLADFPDFALIVTGENDLCHGYTVVSQVSYAPDLFDCQGFTLAFD